MFEKKTVRARCNKCDHTWDVDQHLCVDSSNTEIVQLIEDGLFFTVYCPNCGEEYQFVNPTIYYNDKKKTVICFVEGTLDTSCAEHMINQMIDEFGEFANLITTRLTSTQNEFREKVILDQHSIDDRVVEIMKVLAMDVIRSEGWNQKFSDVRCSVSDDDKTLNIDFVGNEPRHISMDRDRYEKYAKQAKRDLDSHQTPLRVDMDWAISFCESHNI